MAEKRSAKKVASRAVAAKSANVKVTQSPKSDAGRSPHYPPMEIAGKLGEPWVALADGADLSAWGRDEEIAYNQTNRQTEKALFFRRTFDFLTDNRVHGDYFEFGCHRCRTFRMALTEARRHNLASMQFHAFDSFEGLPEPTSDTSVEIWKRGALTTSEQAFLEMVKAHGIYVDRVKTIKGYYSESLTRAAAPLRRFGPENLARQRRLRSVRVCCAGVRFHRTRCCRMAPLSTSTICSPATKVIRIRVVARFLEWQRRSRWKLVRHLDIGWWGRSYIVYLDKENVGRHALIGVPELRASVFTSSEDMSAVRPEVKFWDKMLPDQPEHAQSLQGRVLHARSVQCSLPFERHS
jgi:hypothetical protein